MNIFYKNRFRLKIKWLNLVGSILIIFPIFSGIMFSCRKPVKYSEIPAIKFLSFRLRDTINYPLYEPDDSVLVKMGLLSFSFVDGDGDIGIYGDENNEDTTTTDYTNLRISMYEKNDTTSAFKEVMLPGSFNYRILNFSSASQGQNKTLKGEMRIDLECDFVKKYHIVKFKFFIIDRAQNLSNVDSTGEVELNPLPF